MRKVISFVLSLALCMGLAAPAFGAESGIQVVNTGIRAEGVINYEGYGSLIIHGNLDMDEEGEFIGDPAQIALIDRSGSFVFPYRADPVGNGFAGEARFFCSDGVVSLTLGNAYYNGGIPQYYNLDGSSAFVLEESECKYTENGIKYEESTSWLGGPMTDGYAVVVQKLYSSWTGSWAGGGNGSGDNKTQITDKNGTVTYELPSEYNETIEWGAGGFSTRKSLGWCGEGLFAFFEHAGGDYEQEDYNFYTIGKGYMDPFGHTVIDLSEGGYSDLYPFHEGLAAVKNQKGKIGFIDKTGQLVIPCDYDERAYFCDGLCGVKKDGKWGYIDQAGNAVIPFMYDNAYGSGNGLASVVKDGKCGLVDYKNNIVVPLEYDDISSYEDGIAYGIKGGIVYLISGYRQGNSGSQTQQPATPALPTVEDIPATGTAVPATQKVDLDGKTVEFQCYALKDAKGNSTNYVKIRDLALALNGTKAQFNVGWDGEISIIPNTAYQAAGSEGTTPYSGSQTYTAVSDIPVSFDGGPVNLTSFRLKDSAGNGYTYYKLRDLGQLLDFNVGWTAERGVFIETGKPYVG